MKTPGEKICEVEEYLPGRGTYADDTGVYAKVSGEPIINEKERTVSIQPAMKVPGINVPGSIVYGRVTQIIGQFVLLELFSYNTARFRLVPPGPIGAIHISDIKKEFVEDIHNEFQPGDWVRAKIKRVVKKFYPQLTTVGKELGIIKAFCSYDRSPLKRYGNTLVCPTCGRTYKRKIAHDYGRPSLPR